MKRLLFPFLLLLAAFPLLSQEAVRGSAQVEAVVTLRDLPGLVLAKDLAVDSSSQSALLAHENYRGIIAQAFPQIDLTSNYSLDYQPLQESLTYVPKYDVTGNLVGILIGDQKTSDQASHTVGAKLSLQQILPTAGTLSLSLSHQVTTNTNSSQTINTVATAGSELSQFSQKPVINLGLTQPLFVNGKLIDLGLFPATIQKAELGYLKADVSRRAQSNQSVAQAVQLFLTVIQLRKNIAQMEKAIDVNRGTLDSVRKNSSLGLSTEEDVLDAEIALSNQQQALLTLRANLRRSERGLANSLGRESLDGVDLGEEIPSIEVGLGREDILRRAVDAHPLVVQQRLAAEEKRIDDILSGQKFASTFSLSLSYTPRYPFSLANNPYTTSDLFQSFSDLYASNASSDFTVAAGLTIHLFDGGQQQALRAGNAALTRIADNTLLSQKQALQDQAEADFLLKKNLEEKIAMLTTVLKLARRRLDIERTLLSLGKSTDLSVSARQADYDAKQNDLWRAKADLFYTLLDLSSMAGEDLAETIEGAPR